MAGFLLSGFLLALLGAILPAWGYQRDPTDFVAVGNYFLAVGAGIVVAVIWSRRIAAARGMPFLLVFACLLSCAALAFLAMFSPPASKWWRIFGLLVLGIGAGSLNMALFEGISGSYQRDAAGTAIRGGVWYGLGSMVATLLVFGTYYAYTVPTILLFMAAVPAIFAGLYMGATFPPAPATARPSMQQALKDFRTPGAILFALLLFFQFGNEYSLAGWLPIFLYRRVGFSPKGALLLLALYWLVLTGGRLGAIALLPRVRHRRLLGVSGASAAFGCLLLYITNNPFGATMGAFFIAAGYASIFPLVAEAIGRRFPYYHPGFFNGIFSLALLGGLLAPATLGYAAAAADVRVVIGIPLIGTFLVMALLVLIWLESKVTGR